MATVRGNVADGNAVFPAIPDIDVVETGGPGRDQFQPLEILNYLRVQIGVYKRRNDLGFFVESGISSRKLFRDKFDLVISLQ